MYWISGFLFGIGLGFACNEGDWFPWVNLGGLIIILISLRLAEIKMKSENNKERNYVHNIAPGRYTRQR